MIFLLSSGRGRRPGGCSTLGTLAEILHRLQAAFVAAGALDDQLHFHLTAGQANESTVLDDVLIGADAWLLDEEGEPIAWPLALGGDRAYRANWIDEYLLNLGIKPVIPSRATEHRELRLVKFDKRLYRRRNVVERLIGWLKESRRIFARYEKTAKNFGGMIILAFIRQYLRYEMV